MLIPRATDYVMVRDDDAIWHIYAGSELLLTARSHHDTDQVIEEFLLLVSHRIDGEVLLSPTRDGYRAVVLEASR